MPKAFLRPPVLRSSFTIRHSSFILLLACAFLLTGCELPGVILHEAIGDLPVDALYVLPKGPTLVMVENYRSPDEMQLDGDQIANEVADELKKRRQAGCGRFGQTGSHARG